MDQIQEKLLKFRRMLPPRGQQMNSSEGKSLIKVNKSAHYGQNISNFIYNNVYRH